MSPRPGPRRALVNVRLSVEETARLDDAAADLGVTRSDLIRHLISYGLGSAAGMSRARRTLSTPAETETR